MEFDINELIKGNVGNAGDKKGYEKKSWSYEKPSFKVYLSKAGVSKSGTYKEEQMVAYMCPKPIGIDTEKTKEYYNPVIVYQKPEASVELKNVYGKFIKGLEVENTDNDNIAKVASSALEQLASCVEKPTKILIKLVDKHIVFVSSAASSGSYWSKRIVNSLDELKVTKEQAIKNAQGKTETAEDEE